MLYPIIKPTRADTTPDHHQSSQTHFTLNLQHTQALAPSKIDFTQEEIFTTRLMIFFGPRFQVYIIQTPEQINWFDKFEKFKAILNRKPAVQI